MSNRGSTDNFSVSSGSGHHLEGAMAEVAWAALDASVVAPLAVLAVLLILPAVWGAVSALGERAGIGEQETGDGGPEWAPLRATSGAVVISDCVANRQMAVPVDTSGVAQACAAAEVQKNTPLRVLNEITGVLQVECGDGLRAWVPTKAVLRGRLAMMVCPDSERTFASCACMETLGDGMSCTVRVVHCSVAGSSMVIGLCTTSDLGQLAAGRPLDELDGVSGLSASGEVLGARTWTGPIGGLGFKSNDEVCVARRAGLVEFSVRGQCHSLQEESGAPLFLFVAMSAPGDAVMLLQSLRVDQPAATVCPDYAGNDVTVVPSTPKKRVGVAHVASPAMTPPSDPGSQRPEEKSEGSRFDQRKMTAIRTGAIPVVQEPAFGGNTSPLRRRPYAPSSAVTWSSATAVRQRSDIRRQKQLWASALSRSAHSITTNSKVHEDQVMICEASPENVASSTMNKSSLWSISGPIRRRCWHTNSFKAQSITTGPARRPDSHPIPSGSPSVRATVAAKGLPLPRDQDALAANGEAEILTVCDNCAPSDDVQEFWKSVPTCGECATHTCEANWCRKCLGWVERLPTNDGSESTMPSTAQDKARIPLTEPAGLPKSIDEECAVARDSGGAAAASVAPVPSMVQPPSVTTTEMPSFRVQAGEAEAAEVAQGVAAKPDQLAVEVKQEQAPPEPPLAAPASALSAGTETPLDAKQSETACYDPVLLISDPVQRGGSQSMRYSDLKQLLSQGKFGEPENVLWQYIDSDGSPRHPDPEQGIDPIPLPEYSFAELANSMLAPEYYAQSAGGSDSRILGPFCLLELKQRYIDGRIDMEDLVCGPCQEPSRDAFEEVWRRDDIWHDLTEGEEGEQEEEEEEAEEEAAKAEDDQLPMPQLSAAEAGDAATRAQANQLWAQIKALSAESMGASPPLNVEHATQVCKAITTALSIQSEKPLLPLKWSAQIAKSCVHNAVHESIRSLMTQISEVEFAREALRAIAMLAQPPLLSGTPEGSALATPEMAASVLQTGTRHQGSLRVVVYSLQAISGLGKIGGKISTPENRALYKGLVENPQYKEYCAKRRQGKEQLASQSQGKGVRDAPASQSQPSSSEARRYEQQRQSSAAHPSSSARGPLKADGTPDMRYSVNKNKAAYAYDGGGFSGSACYSVSSNPTGPRKADGTPDMRFKANRR